jgi:hypothetical protein
MLTLKNIKLQAVFMLRVAPPPLLFKIGFLDSFLSTLHLDSARLYNQLHSLSLNSMLVSHLYVSAT